MDAPRHHRSPVRPAALLVLAVVLWAASAGTAGATNLPAGFEEETVATGLDQPSMVAWAPDGRMFVAEKAGQVRVVDAAGQLLPAPVIDISDHVNGYWDHGLLGIAVDASFASNHYLYLLYTYEANPLNPSGPKSSRLTRITVADDNTASAETVLLGTSTAQPCPTAANTVDCIPSDSSSHSIGTVRSDPTDGTLWVGSGDGADYGGVDTRAFRTYDQSSYAGKILHVDRNGLALPGHAFCPSDTDLTHVCAKVHAAGFRNPFRFTLRGGAGPAVGDVGWNSWEEVNLLPVAGGKNYGWPCYEGNTRTPGYDADARCSGAGGEYSKEGTANADVGPVHTYPHPSEGAAIVGGPTYTGAGYPAQYQGSIFFGDYVLGTINLLVPDGQGGWSVSAFASAWAGVDLEAAPGNGDLVYADLFGGEIRRIKFPGTTGEVDYAAGRPTSASSSENASLGPEKAVDGDSTTRWSSGFSDGQWWQVDLGSAKTIDSLELNWETAYAAQYRVETSTDGTNFTTVADETIGQAGLHTTSFAPRSARYVRVTGIARATQFGISFWDAKVFGEATVNQSPAAVATATPTSGSAPLAVAFRGDTSTDPDGDTLAYDWDFGDGTAHATTANPGHTYSAAGSYTARLTVSDGRGGSDSATVAVTATSGNTPPTASITAPSDGSTYRDGVAVSLAGSGQDTQDGALAGAALEWHVLAHHLTHLHDLGRFTGTTASFTPLTDHDADTWYEIILTATDSGGLSATKTVRIDPQTVAFTIASTPAGAPVTYAGTNRVAPYSTRSAVGFKTTVGASDLFTSGANTYLFGTWSDGGAATHNITIPATDTTLTAAYAEDKAALRNASASSVEGTGFEPAKAVDNSSTTRWSSQFLNNQWWQVDLGRTRQVNKVSLNWEAAYATRYDIRVSTNGSGFSTAATVNLNAPGWKTTTFSTRSARYVRVVAAAKKTVFGISFWDARVQGPAD